MKPPSPNLRKIAKMLPRLANENRNEVLATVEGIKRSLASTGHDLHDLVEVIENSWRALPETNYSHTPIAPKWSQLSARERDTWIVNAIHSGELSERDIVFLHSIRSLHRHKTLSVKQSAWVDSLLAKTWQGGRHD